MCLTFAVARRKPIGREFKSHPRDFLFLNVSIIKIKDLSPTHNMEIRVCDTQYMENYITKAVSLFNQIRDRPFRLPEFPGDPNSASCWDKNIELGKLYSQNGYICRPRVCEYRWEDQRISERYKEIPHTEKDFHIIHLVLGNHHQH